MEDRRRCKQKAINDESGEILWYDWLVPHAFIEQLVSKKVYLIYNKRKMLFYYDTACCTYWYIL